MGTGATRYPFFYFIDIGRFLAILALKCLFFAQNAPFFALIKN
jgi:hypothetical protein